MFNDKLRKLRREADLTQKELGDILKYKQTTIATWESGASQPDYETLKQIANFFKVSTDYLLSEDNKKNNHQAKYISRDGREEILTDDEEINFIEDYLKIRKMQKVKQNATTKNIKTIFNNSTNNGGVHYN